MRMHCNPGDDITHLFQVIGNARAVVKRPVALEVTDDSVTIYLPCVQSFDDGPYLNFEGEGGSVMGRTLVIGYYDNHTPVHHHYMDTIPYPELMSLSKAQLES